LASVRARKDNGLLFLDFRWKGKRYREQTALADTPAHRARLEKVLAKIEKQIELGTFDYGAFFAHRTSPRTTATGKVEPDSATAPLRGEAPTAMAAEPPNLPDFRTFTEQWVKEHQVEWRRSHLRTLRSTLERHLLPRFGEVAVSRITKSEVFLFRAELAKLPGRKNKEALSNKRINGIVGVLRQILNEAADRFDFVSPVSNLKPLKVCRSDVLPFTLDEVHRLLATVRPDYRDYLLVRCFTGMRSGEIDGLKWKYVDFDRKLILVREAVVLGEDEYTKTDGSQRDIQMSTLVYEALRRQEAATRKLSDYVFCNREGKPIDNTNFTDRVWRPLLRHLGLQLRRPYQMRHTAATLWVASGESPEWIARQLGHTSSQMLFKVYSRYVPNLTRQDGSAMERLLRATFDASSTKEGEPRDPGSQ
jgi:integrase